MNKIIEVFRQSPLQPLRQHMDQVMACVRLVQPMFEAVSKEQFDTLDGITKEVFKTEHEADKIKDEIRQSLPRVYRLPVFRGDLLGQLKLQDDMADTAEDLAVLLTVKRLALPAGISGEALRYVACIVGVCEQASVIIDRLLAVVATGFQPADVDATLDAVKQIELAEWESDRCQYTLSRNLFAVEHEESPVNIMLWFKIFGELGCLANSAESVGDRIRRMLTSH